MLDISEYAKDFEDLGYTHEKSLMLAKFAVHVCQINPGIGWGELVDSIDYLFKIDITPEETNTMRELVDRGCFDRVNVVTAEDLRKAMERSAEGSGTDA